MKAKSYLLSIWDIIDPIYYSLSRLVCIDPSREGNIFRVRPMRFRGKNVTLSDGTVIRRGDVLLKIHLHNVVLLKEILPLSSELKKGKAIHQWIEQSLPGLARYVRSHPKTGQIKGIVGITTLNKGCRQFGFDTFELSLGFRAMKWIAFFPLFLISVSQPVKSFKKQSPKYVMMSKKTLLAKYDQ